VWASVPRIIFFGPTAPLHYSSVGLRSLESHFLLPSVLSFYSDTDRCPLNFYFGLSMLSSHLSRNMVAINRFGCRMSNTKVSPQLATLDGPVFVSSAL
jgi:hypothetical protein